MTANCIVKPTVAMARTAAEISPKPSDERKTLTAREPFEIWWVGQLELVGRRGRGAHPPRPRWGNDYGVDLHSREAAVPERTADRDRRAVRQELVVLERAECCLVRVELVRATHPDVVDLLTGLQVLERRPAYVDTLTAPCTPSAIFKMSALYFDP